MIFTDPLAELEELKKSIDKGLKAAISAYPCDDSPVIREAMSYSLDGGKRLRGAIVLSTFRSLRGTGDAMPFALAMEMIQAYSLIHDDLPCMDDDDMRRGKPTCHKKFGEAIGVLAGDGLLTLAFEMAASSSLPSERVTAGIRALAYGAGTGGMVGGQVLDLQLEAAQSRKTQSHTTQSEITRPATVGATTLGMQAGAAQSDNSPAQADVVRRMYLLKTGRLFEAAAKIGAILAGAPSEVVDRAAASGLAFGYAYQILDDIDDLVQGGKEEDKDTLVKRTSAETAGEEAAASLRKSIEAGPDWLLARLAEHYLKTKIVMPLSPT